MSSPLFRRVLLKLSGEALMGKQSFCFDEKACLHIAQSLKEVKRTGVEIGLVIGGGNIFRGELSKELGFERTPADQAGMLATLINGTILQQSLARIGVESLMLSTLDNPFIPTFRLDRALKGLESGKILLFVGGTGHPYFTTDTAAALRASEIHADILLKGTKVGGIYSADPLKDSRAVHYAKLTYQQALEQKLKVMDATALALCRENHIPIYVFNLFEEHSLMRAVCEGKGGSLVTGE